MKYSDGLKNSIDFYRNNPLFLIAVMFIFGIIIGDSLMLPWIIYIISLGFFIAIGLFFIRRPTISSLCIHFATFITGTLIIFLSKEKFYKIDESEQCYEAVVASQPVVTRNVYKCDLWVVGKGRPLKIKACLLRRSQIYDDTLKAGNGLIFSASLQNISKIKKHYGKFDYRRWLRINQYDALTFVNHKWQCRRINISTLPSIEKLRINAVIYRNSLLEKYKDLGMEKRSLALVSAMTIGDKSLLDRNIRDDYSISGASHILALSGLHLAVLYTILNLIMNGIAKIVISFTGGRGRIVVNFVKTLLLFIIIWEFAFLVGFTPSITRAAAMISLYSLVDLNNRGHHPFNTLALTAMIILAYNPFYLWDISFQLSFMAVLGIYVFQPKKKLNYLFSLIWVSLSAQMAVMPLILYHFGRFSCYFLLTNIVVVPCANIILYSALILLTLFPIVFIHHAAFAFLSFFTNLLDGWVQWIAALPGASINNIHFDLFQTISLYIIIICVYRIIYLTLHSK